MTEPTHPAAPGAPPAVVIDGLAYAYGRQSLFNALHAHIDRPGIYGLFGRNGSGKSTLLKLLAGLLTPQGGRISVLGQSPRQRAPGWLAQVYILPEEFHLPNLTAERLRETQAGFYPRFDDGLFAAYLRELEVPQAQPFAAMSLGQKKKAAIAFALATQTPLLLLDEPTNGLDIVSRSQFRALMQRPEQAARVVLISTHQAHDLERILSHVWFIDQGALVLSSPMAALAQQLQMGVAEGAAALPPPERLLYQEPLGAHIAWVARRLGDEPPTPVQLELLYKALSLNPGALLAATQATAPAAAEEATP